MELAILSDKYGNFFAPAFAVRVGRVDLIRDLFLAVSQVEVDLKLGELARFTFTVVNSYSAEDRTFLTGRGYKVLELLKFGAEVDICIGYGDARSVPVVASGMITEITTNFPETGTPELSIAGYDHAFPLSIGKNSRTWHNALDSTAVHEITSFHNLNANIETTKERYPQIEQNQESDFEFLKKLADRNHFELFVDEHRTLHFRKPNDTATAVVRLAWGEGLLSFKPEANLAGQIAKVEVYGWDPKKKEKILGVARAGEESGKKGNGKSAGERLKAFVKDPDKQPVLRLRQPVFTQAEAEKRALAALNERAKQFLTGEAETIGLPELRPDRTVMLDNLGAPFSKTYYVQQATHKIDSTGYRTRFKVKETGL
jgi:Bacteriophage probable baseplate hub protein